MRNDNAAIKMNKDSLVYCNNQLSESTSAYNNIVNQLIDSLILVSEHEKDRGFQTEEHEN